MAAIPTRESIRFGIDSYDVQIWKQTKNKTDTFKFDKNYFIGFEWNLPLMVKDKTIWFWKTQSNFQAIEISCMQSIGLTFCFHVR